LGPKQQIPDFPGMTLKSFIMKKLLSLSLVVVFTASCTAQWGKRVKGNGNVTTIERSVGEYDAIGLSGWFDLELVAGEEGKIKLEGESNLLEYIKTEVKNGKLSIKVEKGYNLKPSSWDDGIRIAVPIESISPNPDNPRGIFNEAELEPATTTESHVGVTIRTLMGDCV